jgi:hypothetical protein
VLVVLLATGCDPAEPPAQPLPPGQAALSVSLQTEHARETGEPDRPFAAAWTLAIHETAGFGVQLLSVSGTLRDAATGAPARPNASFSFDQAELANMFGGTRVAPGGSFTVGGELRYALPSGGRRAVFTIAVAAVDDLGHRLSASGRAEIE